MKRKNLEPEAQAVILDTDSLKDMLMKGGEVSHVLSGFEYRPGQVEMAQVVFESFGRDQLLVVEAGTGVGKSLAYGLPAAAWALNADQKVVISSATINLQEQLINKDLPLVSRVLRKPLKAILVKGRANYLCRRRLREATQQPMLLGVDRAEALLAKLADWAGRTTDGSRSDLDFQVNEGLWRQVCSDADTCLGKKCSIREGCFFALAREETDSAQIMVVNHHLLFAELALRMLSDNRARRAILPAFDRVILDEAHELEDAASLFFGIRHTRTGVMRILARLQSAKDERGGLLPGLISQMSSPGQPLDIVRTRELINKIRASIVPGVESVRQTYREAFDALVAMVLEHTASMRVAESRLRFTEEIARTSSWKTMRKIFLRAADLADQLSVHIEELSEQLIDFENQESKLLEARSSMFRIRELAQQTRHLVSNETDGSVRWAEIDRQHRRRIGMMLAPLDVSDLLDRSLYSQMSTTVLTSATLSVKNSFDFVCKRLGILLQPEERRRVLQVPSPFDFATQVRLGVSTDIPAPEAPFFEQMLPEAVYQAIMVSGGRALVLFTSWSLMSRVYELLRERLEEKGILGLCQGQMPRHRLLDSFRNNESSVLFGTESFWQGVDVIGRSLRNVVIVKLPFDVPGEPLNEARMEAIEKEGQNSFMSYMLPRAVLRLKQGFGRLIRSGGDWGVVMILDQRIVTKKYGRQFIKSLPPATLVAGNLEEVCEQLINFFEEKGTLFDERVVRER